MGLEIHALEGDVLTPQRWINALNQNVVHLPRLMTPHTHPEGMDRFTAHIMEFTVETWVGSRGTAGNAWDSREKQLAWHFVLVTGWGWGEEDHVWARASFVWTSCWCQRRKNLSFLITLPKGGARGERKKSDKAQKLSVVNHQKWSQTLYKGIKWEFKTSLYSLTIPIKSLASQTVPFTDSCPLQTTKWHYNIVWKAISKSVIIITEKERKQLAHLFNYIYSIYIYLNV